MSDGPDTTAAEDVSECCEVIKRIVDSSVRSDALRDHLMDAAGAICDGEGRVLAATSVKPLGELGSAARQLASGLSFPVAPGDVVILNDPFCGGSRVLDFYALLLAEVSSHDRPWVVVARCTVPDLGGECFGGYNPDASEVWAEGARVPPLKVCAEGGWIRDTLACVVLNSRTPHLLEAELRGLVEGAQAASARLCAVIRAHGGNPGRVADDLLRLGADEAKHAIASKRRAVDGERSVAVGVKSRAEAGGGDVRLHARMDDGRLTLDLTGSDPAPDAYTNSTRATTVSSALSAVASTGRERSLINDGLTGAIEVLTVPGTIVDAPYPRPTACATLAVGAAVADAVAAATGGKRKPLPAPEILAADGRLSRATAAQLRADEAVAPATGTES